MPMSLPVESNTEAQVDVRRQPVSAVVPSGEVPGAAGETRLRTDVCLLLSRIRCCRGIWRWNQCPFLW